MVPRFYSAFLSYSHDDNHEEGRHWAQWLQEQLETYVIPPDLVGQRNDQGETIPESLYPVFRDRLELRTSVQGADEIQEALKNSRTLIVLCSPRSAQKEWVRKEIVAWRETTRGDRIFPVLIDGDPFRDAFPPELDPKMAIAADLRPGGRQEQGCTTAAFYRSRLQTEGVYSAREIERRVVELDERLSGELRRLIAGLLDIPPGVLEARDAVHRARLAEARANEEEERRIQIGLARDEALRSKQLYFYSLIGVGVLSILVLAAMAFGLFQMADKAKESKAREEATKIAAANEKQLRDERETLLKTKTEAAERKAEDQKKLEEEQVQRLQVEARSAVNTALSLVDTLLEKNRPQDALAHLANVCRRYPDQSLAATRLFSLLSNRDWALPITPPIHLPDENYKGGNPIERARFSPDGHHIVIGRYIPGGGEAEIWNLQNQKLIARDIPCNSQGMSEDGGEFLPDQCFFSPDSRYFASVAIRPDSKGLSTLTLLDLETGKKTMNHVFSGIVYSLRFAPDGKLITGMKDGRLIEWDSELNSRVQMRLSGEIWGLSGDGNTALVSEKKQLRLMPIDSKSREKGITIGEGVRILGFTPDLDVVVMQAREQVGSEEEPFHLRVWHKTSLPEKQSLEDVTVNFIPDHALPISSGAALVLGRLAQTRRLTERTGVINLEQGVGGFFHDEVPVNVEDGFHPSDGTLSQDHRWLATVGDDQTARVWSVDQEGEPPWIVQAAYECSSVDLSRDARQWLIADDQFGSWRLWSIDSTRRELKPTSEMGRVTRNVELLAKDSIVVFREGLNERAYDLATGNEVQDFTGAEVVNFQSPQPSELLNTNGTRKVIGSDSEIVSLQDASSGKLLLTGIPTLNGFARFSPDGKRMLTVSDGPRGRTIQLWDTTTPAPLGEAIGIQCKSAGFSVEGDSIWTISGVKAALSIYDVATHRTIFGPVEIPGIEWVWVSGGVVHALTLQDDRSNLRRAARCRFPFRVQKALPLICDLAEAIASRKVTADGSVQLWPVSRQTFRSLAVQAQQAQGEDPFVDWVRWLLIERDSELGKGLLK